MASAFRHAATPVVGSAPARLLASFEGMAADDILETYELFEDEAIAREQAADHAPEFRLEDCW